MSVANVNKSEVSNPFAGPYDLRAVTSNSNDVEVTNITDSEDYESLSILQQKLRATKLMESISPYYISPWPKINFVCSRSKLWRRSTTQISTFSQLFKESFNIHQTKTCKDKKWNYKLYQEPVSCFNIRHILDYYMGPKRKSCIQ